MPPVRLQEALAQLEEVQLVLASRQEEWVAARLQVRRLTEANARLRQLASHVDDHSITETASIGVAVSAGEGISQQELIKQADDAMYVAKTVQGPPSANTRIALAS